MEYNSKAETEKFRELLYPQSMGFPQPQYTKGILRFICNRKFIAVSTIETPAPVLRNECRSIDHTWNFCPH
jgi:hypothetical protein